MRPVESVLGRLEDVRRNGSGWQAKCPSHDDQQPSLSISEGDKGQVLLHCHAGCRKERILEAAGLRWPDLYPADGQRSRKIAETYDYTDADGELLFQAVRYEPKEFKQRRPDGNGGWVRDLKGVEPVLYRLPQVLQAVREDNPVVVVEGEKDVHRLENEGLAATTNPMGAGKWRDSYSDTLTGAKVIVVPDNDATGRGHADKVVRSLRDKAKSVRVVELPGAPEGGDVSDWLGSGGTVKELLELPSSKPAVTPSLSLISDVTPVTPIRFADMPAPGPREYLVEDLLPKAHTTTLFGDGGSAKSVLAMSLGLAVASGAGEWMGRKVKGGPVLYIDFELDADEQRRRAYQVSRGVFLDAPPNDLLYVSGLGRPASEILTGCVGVCEEYGVGLAIVDSLGIALEGDAVEARDVIRFHHDYLDPFRLAGVTLLVIDHQSKGQAGERYQSKRTFGSVYKENLARSVVQVEPGDRSDGLLNVTLRQTKHNFGGRAKPFGVKLSFSQERIHADKQELDATELAGEQSLNARERVLLVLEDGPSYPQDISEAAQMPLGTVKNALSALRRSGLVENTGEVHPQTRAQRVARCNGVPSPIRGSDTVTPGYEDTLPMDPKRNGHSLVPVPGYSGEEKF